MKLEGRDFLYTKQIICIKTQTKKKRPKITQYTMMK